MATPRGGMIALLVLVGANVSDLTVPLAATEPAYAQVLQGRRWCERNAAVAHHQLFSVCPTLTASLENSTDLDSFWKIIEETRSGESNDRVFRRRINSRLQKLTPDELLEFERHRAKLNEQSYSWALWGAAYLMTGGCGDDCFDYFRGWLISQGRKTFENALKDPDTTLADLGRRTRVARTPLRVRIREFEEFVNAAQEIYETKTDQEMPDSVYQGIARPALGEGWDFNDNLEMKKRYPKLFAKYRKR